MATPARYKLLAIECDDGSTSIMQTFSDVILDAEVRRAVLPSPAVSWREISDAEAAEIRRNRPKPPPEAIKPDATPNDLAGHVKTLAQGVVETDENTRAALARIADLEARLAAIESAPVLTDIREVK